MDDRKADGPGKPEETFEGKQLALYRTLVRKGYRPVPLDPDSGDPSVASQGEFLERAPTDEEMTEWSKLDSHGVGILMDSKVKCIAVFGEYHDFVEGEERGEVVDEWAEVSEEEWEEHDDEEWGKDDDEGSKEVDEWVEVSEEEWEEHDDEEWGKDDDEGSKGVDEWVEVSEEEWKEHDDERWDLEEAGEEDGKDRDVGYAIHVAFGDRQTHAPMVRWKGGRRILIRSSDSTFAGVRFRRPVGNGETCRRVGILGRTKWIPVPPSIDPDTGEPCEFLDPDCTPFDVSAGDLPELTTEDLARLFDALERFRFRRIPPAPSLLAGGMPGLEATALQRVDEWFPKLRLPKTERKEQGHWEAVARLKPSSGGGSDKRAEVTLTASNTGITDSDGGTRDVITLVATVRRCSTEKAAAWLGYVLGIGRNQERLRQHMKLIELEARYNTRRRRREFRGGSFGADWKAGNDRLFARIQSDIPGPMIGREPLTRAFDAILYDREVDPVAEHLDHLPFPDRGPRRLMELPWRVLPAACPVDYAVAVFKSFLLSIMYMAYRPGHVQTDMPILIGDRERISTLLRELCPDPQWFTDSPISRERGRKLSESLDGRMIAEVGGMKHLGKTSVAELRSALETHADPARARSAWQEDRPRLCALIGNETDFMSLPDEVRRSRKFWPVEVEVEMSREGIRDWARTNRDRLLSEIKISYLAGCLPRQVLLKFADTRDTLVRRYGKGHKPFEGRIDRHLGARKPNDAFTMEELFRECGIEFDKGNQNIAGAHLTGGGRCEKLQSGGGEDGRTPIWRVVK